MCTIHRKLQTTNTIDNMRNIIRSVYNSIHCTYSEKTTNDEVNQLIYIIYIVQFIAY